nr:YCF48-related protein [uncultured Albidiferax sp.]
MVLISLKPTGRMRAVLVCAAALAVTAAWAAPVGSALDRPALASPQAAHAVLLGAALAGPRVVAVGERGIVLLSDDAAAHWRQSQVPTSVTLTAVRFVDAQHGWATGHSGVVLATVDGGETWVRQLDGKQAAQLVLDEAQARGDAAAVKNAQRLVADGADKPLLDLHFFDAQRGIVVGAYNLAFITEDGGRSWKPWGQQLDNPKALHLYTVRAQGSTVVIAGEQGLVLQSQDAGQHFTRLTTPYPGSFFTAELPASGEIVLAGLRGNAWRSTDAGATWSALAVAAPISFTASALRAGQGAVLANQGGQLFALRDGVLSQLPGAALPSPTGLLPLADGRLLALTVRGAMAVAAGAAP